jgi:hypothetical protein
MSPGIIWVQVALSRASSSHVGSQVKKINARKSLAQFKCRKVPETSKYIYKVINMLEYATINYKVHAPAPSQVGAPLPPI